jgi:hypothetical protein
MSRFPKFGSAALLGSGASEIDDIVYRRLARINNENQSRGMGRGVMIRADRIYVASSNTVL